MRLLKTIKKILTRPDFGYAAIFLVATAIGAYLQWTPTFVDPDSFYHVKMAQLTAERGPIRDFPWLPFTTLGVAFADHHFFYHVLLIPFLYLFGPIVGAKIATALFFALAITAFYALLRAYTVRAPWFYALILATSSGFIFRANLVKTSAMSVAFLFAALLAYEKRQEKLLFLLAWLYVWSYGGWPLMPFIIGVATAANILVVWKLENSKEKISLLEACRHRREHLGLFASTVGGSIVGLVFNPYFPRNLAFYWEQTVQIGIINYRDKIGVGGEWYGYDFSDIFSGTGSLFVLFLCALATLLIIVLMDVPRHRLRPFVKGNVAAFITSFVITALFFVLTLRSRRYIEYFGPFFALFVALFADAVAPSMSVGEAWKRAKRIIADYGLFAPAAALWFIALFPYLALRDVRGTREANVGGLHHTKYAAATAWLQTNTPEGSLVFHSDWDDFPPLFYGDAHNSYVAGLDPTFLYRQDPLRYWQWVHITTGKRKNGVAGIIRESFDASAVLVEKDHREMREVIEADQNFTKVYADDEVDIYGFREDQESNDRPARP